MGLGYPNPPIFSDLLTLIHWGAPSLVLIIDAIAEVGEPATFDQILQSVSSVRSIKSPTMPRNQVYERWGARVPRAPPCIPFSEPV